MKRKFYLSSVFAACMGLYAVSANAQAPVITMSPTSTTVCEGSTTTLSMTATGATTYKWEVSTDGATWTFLTDGTDYSGTTTTSLVINATTAMNANFYKGIAYNLPDSAVSSSAVLFVDVPPTAAAITGPTLTCTGNTIHLANANTAGTHGWSASNSVVSIASDGTVTAGAAYGMDTITYSYHNTCPLVVTSTVNITVDTTLAHGEISGTTSPICAGTWTNFSETVSGGIWISGNTSIATVDGSGNVTGVSAGTATISYYRSNGCGAVVDTHDITIESMAAPISSLTDSVGVGDSLALSDAATGGIWSSSDATIASVGSSTGLVMGVATGTATVTYSLFNSCGNSEVSMTVYVGTAPAAGAITGVDSVCVGAQITLSNTVPGGTWSSSNTAQATVDASGIVTGVHFGLDTIYYRVTNAFGSTAVRKKIFVNQPPVITITGPTVVALSGGYSLSATPAGGYYTQSNDSVAPLIGYGFFVMMQPGSDTFYYHATNSCGTSVGSFSIFLARVPGVGVTTVNGGTAFKVYPNPSNGAFMITIPSATEEDAVVTITNIAGETVKTMNAKTGQGTSVVFDQPAGMYLISATTTSGDHYTARISVVK